MYGVMVGESCCLGLELELGRVEVEIRVSKSWVGENWGSNLGCEDLGLELWLGRVGLRLELGSELGLLRVVVRHVLP